MPSKSFPVWEHPVLALGFFGLAVWSKMALGSFVLQPASLPSSISRLRHCCAVLQYPSPSSVGGEGDGGGGEGGGGDGGGEGGGGDGGGEGGGGEGGGLGVLQAAVHATCAAVVRALVPRLRLLQSTPEHVTQVGLRNSPLSQTSPTSGTVRRRPTGVQAVVHIPIRSAELRVLQSKPEHAVQAGLGYMKLAQ